MGFRGKQIATLTLVAAVVALASSLVNVSSLARVAVQETGARAELLAETFYHQASRVIRQHPPDAIEEGLTADPSLENYAEGVVGYSSTILYVTLTDARGKALVHSNSQLKGEIVPPVPSFDSFADENALTQMWVLSQGHQVLEVRMPFEVDGRPFGAVRVAISTLLLKEEVSGAVVRNALVATATVLAAFLASFFFANWLLAPIEMLRRELGRIRPGAGEPPLDLRNEADVSRIAEFFASMSQRLDEDRSLRENGSSWLETMVGGLSDAVLVVSGEGRVLSLNPPAERLLQSDRQNIQGQRLADLLPEGHPMADLVDKALSSGEPMGPVNAPLGNGDKPRLYSLHAQVLRDAEGTSGVMLSARDLDKLSRLGSHLSYSQKLAALGRLTSGVAHEIKNPLNAMVIHVALLREKLADIGPDAQGSLDTLEREIRRLDRVIQGFLRFTRPEDLQLTAVPLGELIDEVIRLLSAEARMSRIEIETDIPSDLAPVRGDRELLQQLFVNLLRNACEAMSGGGHLRVTAQHVSDGVEIKVRDEGVGIDDDMLDKVFDLYVTTKQQGSGIGLSMVYRIVQLHDGEITVESEKGKGACFTVHLPEISA